MGIDGGQTQIRLQVVGQGPALVVPGVSHGADVGGRVRDAVASAWSSSHRTAPVGRVVAGLTAVPSSVEEIHALARGIATDLHAAQAWVMDDSVTAHAAAFGGRSGVVVVVGTGVACLAVDAATGAWHRSSGAGYLVGDEGGGFWIGSRGLARALKAHDGRGSHTRLLAEAVERFDCSPDDLAVRLHTDERPVAQIADFAAAVLDAAAAGDAVALEVVAEAADELAACGVACVRQLPAVREGGVVLLGRAVTQSPVLAERVIAASRQLDPELRIEVGTGSPLDGACRLAEHDDLGVYRELVLGDSGIHGRPERAAGSAASRYLTTATDVLSEAAEAELVTITDAAERIADRLERGGMIHTFGTGHSHLLAEEIFYRAGGLARVDPILVDDLMLHVSASESTAAERRVGLARQLLDEHPMSENDALIVASNSGGNAVSVELSQLAREAGVLVVALTSMRHATSDRARASSGPRLHEVADIVLDNHGFVGDAATPIDGLDRRVGPTSTVVGAALLQALAAEVTATLVDRGTVPEVFASSNTEGGDDINQELLNRYRDKVRAL